MFITMNDVISLLNTPVGIVIIACVIAWYGAVCTGNDKEIYKLVSEKAKIAFKKIKNHYNPYFNY